MKTKKVSNFIFSIVAAIVSIGILLPLVWVLYCSFKVPKDFLTMPPNFLGPLTFDNYRDVFSANKFFRFFKNSLTVAFTGSFFTCLMGSLLAYALTRYKFPLKRVFASMYLILRMLPGIMIILPIYIVVSKFNLLDSIFPLIVCYTTTQFAISIWMFQSYFKDVPVSIEESAKIDGCSRLGIIIRIVFPLSITGIAATFVFVFINMWNEFFFAKILTTSRAVTLPLGILELTTLYATEWGKIAAFAVLVISPVLIITFATQKYLVRGMTMGAVKG